MDLSCNELQIYLESFGVAVAKRRKELGISQMELANATDTAVNTIRNIERGKHSGMFDRVIRICLYLDISLDEVLYGSKRYGGAVFSMDIETKMDMLPVAARKVVLEQNQLLTNALLKLLPKE